MRLRFFFFNTTTRNREQKIAGDVDTRGGAPWQLVCVRRGKMAYSVARGIHITLTGFYRIRAHALKSTKNAKQRGDIEVRHLKHRRPTIAHVADKS